MLPILRGAAIAAATIFIIPIFSFPRADAHVTFEVARAKSNSEYRAVLRVPHGCNGQATTAIRVSIPDGIIDAKPMPKPGWTLQLKTGTYAQAYEHFGKTVREGVKEIAWVGGKLPDAYYDEFVFTAWLTSDLAVGKTIYFPVIQDCGGTSVHWGGIPVAGQSRHALPNPAPGILILAANSTGSTSRTPTRFTVGHLVITAPWARATPKGAPVAGGYLKVTNNGSEADRLIGGSIPEAAGFEIHRMTAENGVMKMRPLPNGLEIKPGQTVELAPDGYHIMFTGLKQQLKQGEAIQGTLEFARAGRVGVVFRVGAMGGPAPAMPMDHMPMGSMPMGHQH